MTYRKIFIADNFPKAFESSNVQIPDGQRADFVKLASSKHALVLKFNLLFRAKVYSIILKKYFTRNISDFFKSLILPSRAERAFKAGQMLIDNGFLTPHMVAYNKKLLMTQEVQNSTLLYKLLGTLPPQQKQKMIEQFGQTVGQMHNKGIFHGDLRLGNILVKENNENFEFYFLDNERTKKFNSIPWKLRVKNLVQTNMDRDNTDENDRKLFFDAYIAQQSGSIDAKKLAEEVISKTAKRLDKKLTTNEHK